MTVAEKSPNEADMRSAIKIAVVVVLLVVGGTVALGILGGYDFGIYDGPPGSFRANFEEGTAATLKTEAGNAVRVDVFNIALDGRSFTARVVGLPEGQPGTWYASLDDETLVPLQTEVLANGDTRVTLPTDGPAGRLVDSYYFDPDDSDGDFYFRVSEKTPIS
ncbi:MAG: hypothetical protein R3B97_03660 [Dehalococcoidia bacterium]|nr:hypothetical protein [Dehalococcoidia bacterium]MCB9485584.1 hypothetical protein [Thermoflexaceae bacterium]